MHDYVRKLEDEDNTIYIRRMSIGLIIAAYFLGYVISIICAAVSVSNKRGFTPPPPCIFQIADAKGPNAAEKLSLKSFLAVLFVTPADNGKVGMRGKNTFL